MPDSPELPWIDSHNHLQDSRLGDPEPVILAMRAAGISRCVVNATREEDWDAVLALSEAYPDLILPALGIHPWHAHTAAEGWEERLAILLKEHPQASVGECGLDRWISSPGIDIQMPVFLAQLRIAKELDRPATIHCLKAWDALFDAFGIQEPPGRFLMHSFGGSIEIARRLVPIGAYFSFSGYFLQPRKAKMLDVFRAIPRERLLLETDAPDMAPPEELMAHPVEGGWNHPANLPEIGAALAVALGTSTHELAALSADNSSRCFGNRTPYLRSAEK